VNRGNAAWIRGAPRRLPPLRDFTPFQAHRPVLPFGAMRALLRTVTHAAIPLAVAAVALSGAVAAMSLRWDSGLHLAYQDGQVVVQSVDYATAAQMSQVRSGDVVAEVQSADGTVTEVITASVQDKRDIAASATQWMFVETVPPDLAALETLERFKRAAVLPIEQYAVRGPSDICAGPSPCILTLPELYYGGTVEFHYLQVNPVSSLPIFLGLGILVLGWWLIKSGRAGESLRPYALTLPVATAVPLLVLPVDRYPSLLATATASVLLPLAMLPLAIDFLGRLEGRRRRVLVGLTVLAMASGSIGAGLVLPQPWAGGDVRLWRAGLAGGMVFLPGLLVARPSLSGILGLASDRLGAGPVSMRRSPRAMVESADVLAAAVTPGIAAISLVPGYSVELWPILIWLAVLLIATRFTLRPLMRLALVATRQRDLVVAATEAERARIAADIHDDALQDLTMLVRRLDAAGDLENAQAAREIAQRLRDICGDLRLPVLDDLGVGPALEWLCGRLGSSAARITLDRLPDESRLPADVELAAFRVAQEGLSNAIRHGAPPIVVRYRSGESWIELQVDDSGPGLAADAAETAELTGHLGLLNMAQRAEAIGGTLKIGRRPGGGTRVSLVWERAAGQGTAFAAEPAPA
jgi:signal transduction histidine kinase